MSLGLYRDVLDEEAAYLLSYGDAKLVFAEDEEQVDKLLALADRAPNLKHIVYSDPRGMRKYDDPRLMEAEKLATMGRDRAAREPASTTGWSTRPAARMSRSSAPPRAPRPTPSWRCWRPAAC
jgi:long-chain acyl-CoA synthetase